MFRTIGFIILLIFFNQVNGQTPIASISSDITEGSSPLTIQFINTSTDATTFHWDFGNGNYSNLQNAVYAYRVDGNYTVNLTVVDNSIRVKLGLKPVSYAKALLKRQGAIKNIDDGFLIAREDLEIRGPGEVFDAGVLAGLDLLPSSLSVSAFRLRPAGCAATGRLGRDRHAGGGPWRWPRWASLARPGEDAV